MALLQLIIDNGQLNENVGKGKRELGKTSKIFPFLISRFPFLAITYGTMS